MMGCSIHHQLCLLCILCCVLASTIAASSATLSYLEIRGGSVPQADDVGEDYFEKFKLDYDCEDNIRVAGSTRGLIPNGKLSTLPTNDPFIKWLNEHLEIGRESLTGRVKPYYAADFGSKKSLRKGENPKIIIVNRKLTPNKLGELDKAPSDIDVEVRDVWQPWLKSRCDFAVRYIVPNRINLVKILEKNGQFTQQIEITKNAKGKKETWSKVTFKPRSLVRRLRGAKDITFLRKLDYSRLIDQK